MSTTDTAAAWLADHPTIRRAITALLATHTLALWSVITAPHAAADTGAAALGWTGLKDTDGVPLGDYFLSVVDTGEAVANNGQPLSLLDPTTIPRWVARAAETAATHATAAWWLTNEAAAFVFIVGISLWFLRFTLSSGWLVALAQIGRPVYAAVNTLANQMWLGPLAVTVCICVGGFHMMAGRRGRGWAVIGSGALLTVLLSTVFRDPITDLFSDHGLLAAGRSAGFQLAEATRNGSYAPGQPLDTQLNTLLAQLITAAVRQPLQVFNFGTVVDTIGTCRAAWSAAVIAAPGQGPGPAHAMARCGAPQALAHAQHLGADDFVLGLFFLAVAALVGLFFGYVGITVLLVGLKALFFGVIAGPAFLVGITGLSRAAAYAKHCGWQLFSHAAQMTAFTAYLGITTITMSWVLTTGPIPVVPRMLLLGLAAVAAALLFRFIDHSFHTDGIGTIAHQIRSSAAHPTLNQVNEQRGGADRVRRPISRSVHPHKDQYDVNEDARGSDAEFPTVPPRPTHTRTPAAAIANADTPPARSTAAAPAETGTAAAETGAAAAVAAPEVGIPVIAVAVAKHAHTHHRSAPHPGPVTAWPQHQRPAGPHTTGTRASEPFAAPPLAPAAATAADELPLEFPSTAPRQRPHTPEGDPT